MPLRIVDKPSSDPVSLAEAKAQLRLTDASQDVLVKILIAAATKQVQSLVQRVFMEQTLEWVLPAWRAVFDIPVAPVAADGIASIKYVDWTTQTQQTLAAAAYVVQTKGDSVRIFPKYGTAWPVLFAYAPEPVVIQFTAGYESAADVPENVKAAILLQIRHLYSLGERSLALTRDLVIGVGEKQFNVRPEAMAVVPDAVKNLVLSEVW
jgi:uncharacterized phiE125 gp8 family phage protein